MNQVINLFGICAAVNAERRDIFERLAHHVPQAALVADGLQGDGADVNYRIIGPRAIQPKYIVLRERRTVAEAEDAALACEYLVRDLHSTLGRMARGWTFIHAGVVELEGRAVLLPGRSRAGKTTLVDALVRLGARYGSDELAALDADGRVHSYARPLGIRRDGGTKSRVGIGELHGQVMVGALIPGVIVFTSFVQGASFAPEPMTPADAALRLLEHCLGARGRPAETLATLCAISTNADGWRGPRGDADETAQRLIGMLSSTQTAHPTG